jgi:hypothetical protein
MRRLFREGGGEALIGGVWAGLLSREIHLVPGADAVKRCGRPCSARRCRKPFRGPARSESPGTHDRLHAREPGDLVVARQVVVDAPSGMVRGVADQGWAGREGNV